MVLITRHFGFGQFCPIRCVGLAAILAFLVPEKWGPEVVAETESPKNEVLRTVLEAVQDRTEYIDEIGLYLLLRELDEEGSSPAGADIEEVTWSALILEPAKYRGRWVRVACRFVEADRGQLDNPQLFEKPIFTVMGVEEGAGEPVSMVATVGPGFARNDPVWLAGRFFKIRAAEPRTDTSKNQDERLLIPVLVGHEVRARNAFGGADSGDGRAALTWTVGAVGGLLVLWMIARGRSNKSERHQPRRAADSSESLGKDAFEPIDLEQLERDLQSEDGKGG